MIYDIANPSDPYTLAADDFKIAAVAVGVLGGGAYGIDGTPVLFGWDDWFKEQEIDLPKFVEAHLAEIADVLDSVLIGNKADREECEGAISRMPPSEHASFLAERHNKRRSSMNDIGGRAKNIAAQLRKRIKPTP